MYEASNIRIFITQIHIILVEETELRSRLLVHTVLSAISSFFKPVNLVIFILI